MRYKNPTQWNLKFFELKKLLDEEYKIKEYKIKLQGLRDFLGVQESDEAVEQKG